MSENQIVIIYDFVECRPRSLMSIESQCLQNAHELRHFFPISCKFTCLRNRPESRQPSGGISLVPIIRVEKMNGFSASPPATTTRPGRTPADKVAGKSSGYWNCWVAGHKFSLIYQGRREQGGGGGGGGIHAYDGLPIVRNLPYQLIFDQLTYWHQSLPD